MTAGTPAADWVKWGPVYDRQATVGVIVALQKDGFKVRAVKNGNHNDIYVMRRSS